MIFPLAKKVKTYPLMCPFWLGKRFEKYFYTNWLEEKLLFKGQVHLVRNQRSKGQIRKNIVRRPNSEQATQAGCRTSDHKF